MKKFSILTLVFMFALAMTAMPVFAGPNCSSKASASADKAACTASKKATADASDDEVNAKMANATDKAKSCASKASATTAKASSCSGKDADAHMINAKSGSCSSSKGASAQAINSTDKAKAASCAKTCGVEAAKACTGSKTIKSAEADKEVNATMASAVAGACPTTGKCQEITLAIKGMTCSGCEAMITKALMETDGVYKVASIDHKNGTAQVCVNPSKMEGAKLANVVTGVGYESTVSHAGAVHTESSEKAKSCASKASADKKDMGY